jgi:hypothetical protein
MRKDFVYYCKNTWTAVCLIPPFPEKYWSFCTFARAAYNELAEFVCC